MQARAEASLAAQRADLAEGQLALLRARAQGLADNTNTRRAAALNVREATSAADAFANELGPLRKQLAAFQQHSALTAEHVEVKRQLADYRERNRQNAAKLGKAAITIRELKAAGGKGDAALAATPELRAEGERLVAKVDSLTQELAALRCMPHTRPVRARKGQPGRWQLILPHWDAETSDYELPVLDVHVQRNSRKGGAAPGGVEFHVLLQLLMLEIPALFEVAFDRVGDLVALVLKRLRICKLSRCAPYPVCVLIGLRQAACADTCAADCARVHPHAV